MSGKGNILKRKKERKNPTRRPMFLLRRLILQLGSTNHRLIMLIKLILPLSCTQLKEKTFWSGKVRIIYLNLSKII